MAPTSGRDLTVIKSLIETISLSIYINVMFITKN
jgi:hypothetical protein